MDKPVEIAAHEELRGLVRVEWYGANITEEKGAAHDQEKQEWPVISNAGLHFSDRHFPDYVDHVPGFRR